MTTGCYYQEFASKYCQYYDANITTFCEICKRFYAIPRPRFPAWKRVSGGDIVAEQFVAAGTNFGDYLPASLFRNLNFHADGNKVCQGRRAGSVNRRGMLSVIALSAERKVVGRGELSATCLEMSSALSSVKPSNSANKLFVFTFCIIILLILYHKFSEKLRDMQVPEDPNGVRDCTCQA